MTLPTPCRPSRSAPTSPPSFPPALPSTPAALRPPVPRLLARLAVLALLAGAAGLAAAAPDGTADGGARFVAERGLAGDAAAALPGEGGLIDRMASGASELALGAMAFIGVPYRRGGNSESEGFDCSGLTRRVFASVLGLVLPRRSNEQAAAASLVDVPRDDLKPGDLVFFNTLRHAFSHVGIYIGEGRFVHAPRSGAEVRIEDMRSSYWTRRFDGARRAAGRTAPLPADDRPS